jgi:N-acetylmuramoyl-L-alanine amidase
MREGTSASQLDRLKREMLRQAVEENLDLIHGRAARPAKPVSRSPWPRAIALVLAVPAGVLASTYALTSNHSGPAPQVALASVAGPSSPAGHGDDAPEIVFPTVRPGEATPASAGLPGTEPAPELLEAASTTPLDPGIFPLEVRRVVVDPGHGGEALGTHTGNGMVEKEITLDIGVRLKRILAEAGFEVVMTRERDEAVSLQRRAEIANQAEADIFVSIHVNWIDDGGDTRGVETYFLGAAQEAYLNRLAALENHDSGYAMADLRGLLDKIYSGVRVGKSKDLAASVQASLYRSLAKVNPQLKNRGVKTAPFVVLVDTEMPAILAEVSCLSNDREASLLSQPLYRQFIAESLARGVQDYASPAAEPLAVAASPARPPAEKAK